MSVKVIRDMQTAIYTHKTQIYENYANTSRLQNSDIYKRCTRNNNQLKIGNNKLKKLICTKLNHKDL